MHKHIIKLRSSILVFLTHNMALPFLKFVRKPVPFPYTMAMLQNMPAGTLGNDLALFLQHKKLQLLPYYAKHDIKHILLQYDTTDEGEVSLQCFMLGNGHVSVPVAATVLYGFLTMPEYYKNFIAALKKGIVATNLKHWQWHNLLGEYSQHLTQLIYKNYNDRI